MLNTAKLNACFHRWGVGGFYHYGEVPCPSELFQGLSN